MRDIICVCVVLCAQGDTPKNRAEKAHDAELAAYLENRQHYQMIQREDQETAVWTQWTLDEQDSHEETAFCLLPGLHETDRKNGSRLTCVLLKAQSADWEWSCAKHAFSNDYNHDDDNDSSIDG